MVMATGNGSMLKRLERISRVIFTGIAYALFGGMALLSELIMPLYLRFYPAGVPRELAARKMVSRLWWGFTRYLQLARIARVRMDYPERLGKPGQLILVNHPSLLDVVLLLSLVPGSNCIVKRQLWDNPFIGRSLRRCGFIANNENEHTLNQAITCLQQGQTLVIFPEGTRTPYGGKVRFNRAAVTIGLKAASEIIPVVIRMNPPGIKRGDAWYKIPEQTYQYDFRVGEAIIPADCLADKPLPVAAKRLNQQLIDYFQQEV